MKKIYMAVAFLCSSLWVASQDIERMSIQNQKQKLPFEENQKLISQNQEVSSKSSSVSFGDIIGQTTYDFQSNYGTGNSRIQQYNNGEIVAVWIQSLNLFGGHQDRGTGYNIFDPISQSWDTGATDWYGLNTVRTSCPQILNLASKEFTIQHDFAMSSIVENSRDTIGQGFWGISNAYSFDAVWPRAVNVNDTIHMIALDNQNGPYNGINNPLKYFRSDDAGQSWSISSFVNFPSYDNSTFWFSEISAEAYAIDAYENYVAIAIGGGWDPLVLYKSDNYGESGSWTKTIIYHPDTSYAYTDQINLRYVVPSLSSEVSIVIDENGLTHLSTTGTAIDWYFGEDKPQDDNGLRHYNPFASLGIYYWNENIGRLDGIYNEFVSSDTLTGNVLYPVSHFYDYTGEGNYDISNNPGEIGTYSSGLAGHSNIAIDQDSGVFMVWSQVAETSTQLLPDYYRDLYFAYSFDKGNSWNGPISVASLELPDDGFSGGTLAEEDVFPSTIKRIGNDDLLHMIFQSDAEAGMHVAGDLHPIGFNDIVYYPIDIQQIRNISSISNKIEPNIGFKTYPNPNKGIIIVEFDDSFYKQSLNIKVYNLIGREMKINSISPLDNKRLEIDISDLENGIYLLKVPIENKEITLKIIKE